MYCDRCGHKNEKSVRHACPAPRFCHGCGFKMNPYIHSHHMCSATSISLATPVDCQCEACKKVRGPVQYV